MALNLGSELKKDLLPLMNVPDDKAEKFAVLVSQALRGVLQEADTIAMAEEMACDSTELETGLNALCFVISELVRLSIKQEDGATAFIELGFPDGLIVALNERYDQFFADVRAVAESLGFSSLPSFRSLDWRLEVEAGSRMLRSNMAPTVTLRLQTANPRGVETLHLQADVEAVDSACEALAAALQQLQSPHCRRVARVVNSL